MTDRSNILCVYVDQMRADAMGCVGNPDVKTPYLDRLAEEGLHFTNAFVSTPLCSPFRGSLLTGKYSHSHGVYGNNLQIDTNQEFLPQAFKDAGYRTGFFGKWHLGGSHKPGFVPPGEKRCGFDHFVGFNRGHRYLKSIYFKDTPQPYHCPRFEPDFQTDHLIDFMAKCHEADDSFFAMLCIGTPHFPNDMPSYWRRMYDPASITLPTGVPNPEAQAEAQKRKLDIDQNGDENGLNWSKVGDCTKSVWETETEEEIRGYVSEYYALVSNIDHNVGRILHWLDRQLLADDTVVVFLSDHGDMHGQKGHLCGIKRSPYRESMQVPFLFRYPKRLAAGRKVEALCDVSVDTMPTLLSLCGMPVPDAVQGIDQLSVFEGSSDPLREAIHYELLSQDGGGEPADCMRVPERGIRTNEWMYCRKPNRRKYLFDLLADPGETDNLVDDDRFSQVMEQLDARIDAHMDETDDNWALQATFPYPDMQNVGDITAYLDNVVLPSAIIES